MMAQLLALSVLVLPVMLAIVLLTFPTHWKGKKTFLWSFLVLSLVILMIAAAFFADDPPRSCVSWQPVSGEMCVSFGRSTLVVVFLVTASLLVWLLMVRWEGEIASPQQTAFALISLSMANIAFLAEHFLLRYVALEFVGLGVVVAAWLFSTPREKTWSAVKSIFINFRIGDLGLLISIFGMYSISGTFHIDQNLMLATLADPTMRAVLILGFALAVCVKMAVFPLDRWVDACASLPRSLKIWFTRLLLPALGAYLLYRIAPLLLSGIVSATWILTLLCALFLIKTLVFSPAVRRSDLERDLLMFFALCLLLLAAFVEQDLLWALLLLWLLIRAAFAFCTGQDESCSLLRQYRKGLTVYFPYFLISGFAMIVLWWMFSLPQPIPPFLVAVYLLLFGIQFLHIQRFMIVNEDESGVRVESKKVKHVLKLDFFNFLTAVFILAVFSVVIFFVTRLIKGEEIWVVPVTLAFQNASFSGGHLVLTFGALAVVVMLANIFGKFATKLTAFSHEKFHALHSFSKKIIPSASDRLDVSNALSAAFVRIATYVYEHVEHNLLEKFVAVFERVFRFLFMTVEKFTSADLWKHALDSVMKSSRRLQRMHAGLLRINLFWLFFVLVVLIVFVLVVYRGAVRLVG